MPPSNIDDVENA